MTSNAPPTTAPAAAARSARRWPRLEAAVAWLAAAGLVVLVTAVSVLAVQSRERSLADAEKRAEAAAHVLAEHAARLLDAADLLVEQASQQARGRSWDDIESSRTVWENLRGEEQRLPFLDAVWLNDETGRLRLSTIAFPTPPSNAADRDFFRAHLEGPDRPHISERIVGRVTGKPTFLVSRRLTDRDGRFRGIASVTVDPAYFGEFYRQLDLLNDPSILLFRSGGFDVLVRQPDANSGDPAPLAEAERRLVLASPVSGAARADGIIFAHRHVGEWPLHVAVRVDQAPVLAAWRAELVPYAGLAVAAGAALLALSAFGFRQARDARLMHRKLELQVRARTASLEAALRERDEALVQKDLLMREVNHRVKNSLQVVSSLLSLQGQSVEDPVLRGHLGEAGRRVRAVSDIHQLLYKVEDVRVIPFHDYLTALCRDLERSALAGGEDWRLELAVEPVEVPTDQAVPLGLIANELLMNAVKHAYPHGGPKPIAVGLSRASDSVRLTVADRGVGLPDGFDWQRSHSLGMRLVHALSSQLRARLAVERREPGASFAVEVPFDEAA